MMIVGLTGSFGTGKTTVAKMFKRLGADIIDADKIAHELIRLGTCTCQKIISIFGKKIFKKGSTNIDRKKLAKIVFKNKRLLKKLNRIMHPQIIKDIKQKISKSKHNIIVLDAPLLIETGLSNIVDKLIVVSANKKIQLRRLRQKKDLTKEEITGRISAQLPLAYKIKKADFVIDNNGARNNTYKQVKGIWEKINK